MDVSISPGALDYIREHGISTIVFDLVDMETGGCVGVVKEVSCSFHPPQHPQNYRQDRVQDVDVYVHRRLRINGPVRIKKQGFWKFSSLYADGLLVPI